MTLTFSHLSADTFESSLKAGRKRPRVREALSCWQCRVRKTRCDRGLPCEQCQDRDPAECYYGAPDDNSRQARPRTRPLKRSPATQTATPILEMPPTPSQSQSPASRGISSPEQVKARNEDDLVTVPQQCGPANAFQGKGLKTRLIGLSHWMAPCREMPVIKAMLDRSVEFEPSREAFREFKALLHAQYALPAPLPWTIMADGSALRLLLPDRHACETWAAKFCQTYNRVYGIVDQALLISELGGIYDGSLNNPVHIARLLLVTAIGMQGNESDRLRGRVLAGHIGDCIQSSLRFQKPCIGAVQNLILLMLMKTISASDTDRIYKLLVLQGLASQILSSMGLHRDPSLFPGITSYAAEVRKRLWACFLRLSLEYSMRSGAQFNTRLEESDCPLPTPTSLQHLPGYPITANRETGTDDEQEVSDANFAIAAANLAKTIAPIYQSLYLPDPPDLWSLQSQLRTSFASLTANLPPPLRPGAWTLDSIIELQQSILVITMQSFLTVITLGHTLGTPSDFSQRSRLIETWDHASFVTHQFQSLCEKRQDLHDIACHLLWADVIRAALTACWTVGRLRHLDYRDLPSHPQQTVRIFQQLLTQSLSRLSQFWQTRFHLGPVTAKINLILAVALSVAENLYSDNHSASAERSILEQGVTTADRVISQMTATLQRRLPTSTGIAAEQIPSTTTASVFLSWNAGESTLPDPTGFSLGSDISYLGQEFLDFDFFDTPFSAALPNFGFPAEDGILLDPCLTPPEYGLMEPFRE